jgi:hypothetical protein
MVLYDGELSHMITAIGIVCWFKGIYRIMDQYISDTMKNNVLLVLAALTIFYFHHGTLEALGKMPDKKTNKNNKNNKNKQTNK